MRHGEAEDASPDYTRKLTWKGEEQVYSVAEQLQQKRLRFDIILASGASRTTQTATIIHEYFEQGPQLLISPQLYNFSFGACQEVLALLRPDIQSILIVGHNPGISRVSNQISQQKMCKNLYQNIQFILMEHALIMVNQMHWQELVYILGKMIQEILAQK